MQRLMSQFQQTRVAIAPQRTEYNVQVENKIIKSITINGSEQFKYNSDKPPKFYYTRHSSMAHGEYLV